MSIKTCDRVWALPPSAITATERLVLLCLADHGHDDGENARPSIRTIAAETSLTPRGVQKTLRRLTGRFIREVGHRSGGVTIYAVALDALPLNRDRRSRSPVEDRDLASRSAAEQPVEETVAPRTTFTPEPGSPLNHVHPTPEPGSGVPLNHVHLTPEPGSPEPSMNRQWNRQVNRQPAARSKRPIFTGQRLIVFDWMLDDLTRMLGSHTDAFDLHEWFFTLDTQAVASGCVIPQRDGGAWLQGQTLAEAQRRRLPIAVTELPPTAGKLTTRLAAAVANIQREAAQS